MLKSYGHSQQNSRSNYRFYLLLLAITLLRLLYLATVARPLNVDEAQYWLWSQHLSWGYHSKPPLIAGVIWLSSHLLGHHYFALRCTVPLAYLVGSCFIYLSARRLFLKRIAYWSALSFLLLPSISFSSTMISTDPFMLMFWAMALYFFIAAWQSGKLFDWLLMGLALGCCILAKYTGILFIVCLILFLLIEQSARHCLRTKGFYLALLLCLLLLLPNILWNSHHGMETIRNVASHNIIGLHGIHFNLSHLFNFMLNQIAIFSLILLPFYIIALFNKKYWQGSAMRLLWCFSLPILLLIIIESLFSSAKANWSATAYIAVIILVTAVLLNQNALKWLKLNLFVSIIVWIAMTGIELTVLQGWVRFHHYTHFYRHLLGWQTTAKPIKMIEQRYPHANFLFDSRTIWAKSIYYGNIPLSKVYVWQPHQQSTSLDSWQTLSQAVGNDFIYMGSHAHLSASVVNHFQSHQQLRAIPVCQFDSCFSTIYVYYLSGFKGY